MAYLKALLKVVKANPKLLPAILRMIADALEANPGLAEEVMGEIQQAKT